jgi:hypothetical protein
MLRLERSSGATATIETSILRQASLLGQPLCQFHDSTNLAFNKAAYFMRLRIPASGSIPSFFRKTPILESFFLQAPFCKWMKRFQKKREMNSTIDHLL